MSKKKKKIKLLFHKLKGQDWPKITQERWYEKMNVRVDQVEFVEDCL